MAELSTFAGLEILAPGDPISTNGFQFTGSDRRTIDQWLSQIPAHRHDAHAPLADPPNAPSVTPQATGGNLPSDTTVFVGYTLLDGSGGETAISPATQATTPGGIGTAPDLASATISNASGQLTINTYTYVFTAKDDAGGESLPCDPIQVDRLPGAPSAQVEFTGLDSFLAATAATTWTCYKATGGAAYEMLTQGTGATLIDDGTIPLTYGTQPPGSDTTNQTGSLQVTVPGVASAGATAFSIYLSQTDTFADPSLYGTFPAASAGAMVTVSGLSLSQGAPPPKSTATRGAALVNALTDISNLHWRAPVATMADLPTGVTGDVCFAYQDDALYGVDSDTVNASAGGGGWNALGGGGGGGSLTVTKVGGVSVSPVTEIDFDGTVAVTDEGGGVARVTITGGGGGGGGGGTGGGGDAFWAFYFAAANGNLTNDDSISAGGEFSSFGVDGTPNVNAINATITVPAMVPNGTTDLGSGSVAVVWQTNGSGSPWVSNFASGAANSIQLFVTVTVSDADQSNYMVILGSTQINPTDAAGTTVNIDTASVFDWSQAIVVESNGTELFWDALGGQWIVSSNLAGSYWVMANLTAIQGP